MIDKGFSKDFLDIKYSTHAILIHWSTALRKENLIQLLQEAINVTIKYLIACNVCVMPLVKASTGSTEEAQ